MLLSLHGAVRCFGPNFGDQFARNLQLLVLVRLLQLSLQISLRQVQLCDHPSAMRFMDRSAMPVSGSQLGRAAGPCIHAPLPRAHLTFSRRHLAQRRVTTCMAHRITVLPGDGIGPEITKVALHALEAAGQLEHEQFDFSEQLIGGAAIDATGKPLPEETLHACKESDAVLLAAIGGYQWDTLPADQRPERGLLALRAGLNAFANLRPAIVLPQLADASSLKREIVEGTDIMIVRELVGGIYFGEPRGFKTNEKGEKVGFNTMIYSEPEVERIAKVAFESAQKRKGKLCSVEKSNVLEVSQLWKEVVTRVGKEYPDVELTHMYIDNAAMQLLRNPKVFDTIVTGNIFGDILSDEASMLTGSLGMLPSASISIGGPGIFEPVHGSAPDIAGQDKANPMAMVLSAAMMCRYGLNLPKVADRLEQAVTAALDAGYRTGDLMSSGMKQVGCVELGDILVKQIKEKH